MIVLKFIEEKYHRLISCFLIKYIVFFHKLNQPLIQILFIFLAWIYQIMKWFILVWTWIMLSFFFKRLIQFFHHLIRIKYHVYLHPNYFFNIFLFFNMKISTQWILELATNFILKKIWRRWTKVFIFFIKRFS